MKASSSNSKPSCKICPIPVGGVVAHPTDTPKHCPHPPTRCQPKRSHPESVPGDRIASKDTPSPGPRQGHSNNASRWACRFHAKQKKPQAITLRLKKTYYVCII